MFLSDLRATESEKIQAFKRLTDQLYDHHLTIITLSGPCAEIC